MKRTSFLVFFHLVCMYQFACAQSEWVNPFVGTGGHGHTFPGATAPFGMVQLSPDSRLEGWDGCGGYHYSDSMLYGFSHTHLQGTGVSDYGDILFMPTNYNVRKADTWNAAYPSRFRHETEKASPGFYSVKLDDYNITAELTATARTGIHRYTFAPGDSCRLFIDMMHRDEIHYYDIQTIGDTVVYGYRVSKAWAEKQHCYFYAVFSKPFKELTQLDVSYDETFSDGNIRKVIEQVQVFALDFGAVGELNVRVGISGTDVEGAKKNLYAEAPSFGFERYKAAVAEQWNEALRRVPCPVQSTQDKQNFYSSLYHCYTTPNVWSDVDGRYRGMDQQIHQAEGFTRYTVFSLWDTFRGLHPLLAEFEPQRTRDFIRTFLSIYDERGELPVWELAANETYCMIGYHSVSAIADAYFRGIRDFDHRKALSAMIAAANGPQEEKKYYAAKGYVPADLFSESVSKTLEFAYDDWCIAQFAFAIGEEEIGKEYARRSQHWKNLFDPQTKFFRPRKNGSFPEPFDPYQVDFNFTEANAWQYRLFVPQAPDQLAAFFGGKKALVKAIDEMLAASTQTTGREQADITGLIGQYAHGNEPSHHVAALYRALGEAKKANKLEREILTTMYAPTPEGLCGNEDCGQMSAWYVLTTLGKYPLCPGGAPSLHAAFDNVVPMPVIEGPALSFKQSAQVWIKSLRKGDRLRYTVTNDKGEIFSFESVSPALVQLESSSEITAVAIDGEGRESNEESARFVQRSQAWSVKSITPYSAQYTGGGDEALIDGGVGSTDFRTGSWQGFRENATIVIDLGQTQSFHEVRVHALQDIKSWIWFPSSVEVATSTDGVQFERRAASTLRTDAKKEGGMAEWFAVPITGEGRYVKITLHKAFAQIPEWHLGAGETPWIFADEIEVK